MEIILPKTSFDISNLDRPIFFAAGPDGGGGNWRARCCDLINQLMPDSVVVVPCRWKSGDKFFSSRVNSGRAVFSRQAQWEHFYLSRISELSIHHRGCILFWLPEENKKHPRNDGQPFARDSRGEIARWGRNAALTGAHIVVGAQPFFPGLRTIRENLRLDFNMHDEFPIFSTLEETVSEAIQWVKETKTEERKCYVD